VYGSKDAGIPVADVHNTAERISGVELYEFTGDHFDAYDNGAHIQEIVEKEITFFTAHLSGA
jgi:hypothetical protein